MRAVLLILILLLASVLRLYDLGNLPSGFHNDEASFFLNAQALKTNLHDEDNRYLPLYLNSFMDPKPALYSYLQIPFIAVLGETHTAARLPAAVFGILSLFLTYLLLRKLTNTQIALLGTCILAISPWHIMLSRASQEVIMSFTLTIAAVLMLIEGLKSHTRKKRYYGLFLLLALLSMYSYHSAKIFLPLLSTLVLIHYLKAKRLHWKSFLILLIGMGSVTGLAILAGGFARYDAVSIFQSPSVQLIIDEQIRTATGHADPFSIRLFTNKLISYTLAILHNYGEYFSVSFLFIDGGQPTRYVVPFHGLLYVFEGLLIILGVVYGLTKDTFRKVTYFFLAWLLLVPLPSALTVQETPSVIRTFPMIIPLIVFISFGICALWAYSSKKVYRQVLSIVLILFYIGGFGYYWFQFSVQQPYYHPWSRHYGSEQLPYAIMSVADKYEHIYVSTNQYVYFALAKTISIDELQHTYPKRTQDTATFGKITFVNKSCNLFPTNKHVLFVARNDCPDKTELKYKKVGQVNFKDSNPEYVFYEAKKVPLR